MSERPPDELTASVLNVQLHPEICQQIHYAALCAAARGVQPAAVPVSVPLVQIQQLARLHGATVYLAHPAVIDEIFNGVTLRVYQAVETLYCDRLERSIQRVWQILKAMTDRVGLPTVQYEAVWAICLYLEDRRALTCHATLQHLDNAWWVVKLVPDVHLQDKAGAPYRVVVACVLDTVRVLAFRVTPEEQFQVNVSLAIYDAIVSQRQPAAEGAAGLIWRVPKHLLSDTDISGACRRACAAVHIEVEPAPTHSPLMESWQADWTRDLSGRLLQEKHFAVLFDNYLSKRYGYGPLTAQRYRDRECMSLIGYSRDPAGQLAALREFLPLHPGVIAEDGAVEYDGLHYADELLTYWIDHPVTLRRSESAEAVSWVYLEGEMLCQVMARELKRKDGSYRPNRPRK